MKGRKVPPKISEMIPVHITSGYGGNTHQPFVELEISTFKTQMSPAKAREIARWLLEAAEAAESDQFLVMFFQRELDLTTQESVAVLSKFRHLRLTARGEQVESA